MEQYENIQKTIDDSWKRYDVIDKMDKDYNNKINIAQLRWKNNIEDYKITVESLKKEIDEIKKDFKTNVNYFLRMVSNFKNTGTKEEFEKLKKLIDEQNYEGNIGRIEFKKLILLKLKEYLT